MFSSFRDAFVRKPQFIADTPLAVMNALNKDLPEGFHYVEMHDGICRIDCDDQFDISIDKIGAPKESETLFASLGITPTIKDIFRVAYNAQLPIEILPDEEGNICVNGTKIPLKDFLISPMGRINFTNNHLCIMPKPFPDPVTMDFSGNGGSLSIDIQRVPFLSLNEVRFESVGETALKLGMIVDTVSKSVSISASTQVTESAREALASRQIYNAFASGEVIINGESISFGAPKEKEPFSKETIDFWKKIIELEQKTGLAFNASIEIDSEQFGMILELYRCIVEEKPFKRYLKDATLKGKGAFDKKHISSPNSELMFAFTEETDICVMGAAVHLFTYNLLFHCSVSFDKLPEGEELGEFCIRINPVKDSKLFSSLRHYLSKEEMESVVLTNEEILKYYNADEIESI